MTVLDVDGLIFTFPAGWKASKFDEWSFYRHQFAKQGSGIKAVDLVAVGPGRVAYLIEVKDYRHPDAEKPSGLAAAIAGKVMDTLAAMLPAKLLASVADEQAMAAAILQCTSLRIVAHIEQPPRHMPLVDVADIKQKLKQVLRAIDLHPKVVSMQDMKAMAWTVS